MMAELIAHTFLPLSVSATPHGILISGTTFRYRIARSSGLFDSLRVLGREWLAGRPLPDLWVSSEVDPRRRRWEAARETQARVRIVKQTPEQVVIEAGGRYLDERDAFPLRYRLRYTFDCDGVVRVEVENRGTGRGDLRWLVFSAASVKRELVDFYSHIEDLADAESTGEWVTQLLPKVSRPAKRPASKQNQEVYAGRFVPWVQLGNDESGLDLTMDDGVDLSHGCTDSEPSADPLGTPGRNFVLAAEGDRVRWTYYSVRNLCTPLRTGWHRANRFYLAPVPAKRYHPSLADLRVHWMGPHQIDPSFVYPTDEEIAGLARRGTNLLIGCAHWRSGDYSHPDKPKEIRRVIAACHRHGMRIIPYLTFTDMDHPLPAFQAHGQDWQIEPVAEYRHLTNLMCYGAEGWREHWKREMDTVLERFDFDGLYIDFWVGKMACRNTRHGCGLKYPRFTLPGLRDMAWHAYRAVKAKGADKFILSNTNLFAGALVNNLVDIRLPGEWADIEETPAALVRGHLNSRRLGCNALLLPGRIHRLSLRSVSFSLRCQSPMVIGHGKALKGGGPVPYGPRPEGLLMQYADLLRFFGLSRASFPGAWERDVGLRSPIPDWHAYWCRNDQGTLIVVANLAPKPTRGHLKITDRRRLGLGPGKRYLVYRPDREVLLSDEPVEAARLRQFDLSQRAYEPALLFLTPTKGRPQPLWATLSDGFAEESHRGQALLFTVRGEAGVRSRVAVYMGERKAKACRQGERLVPVARRGALAMLEVDCNQPVRLELA